MEVYQAGETVYWQFNTRDGDGAPITFAGSPAVACVKDSGTTTDTDGVSLTVDAGSVTGRHILSIDTSQDATFYATGHEFSVIVTAGTVDGTSVVGEIVLRFRLGEVPADVQAWDGGAVPTPATAAALDVVDGIVDSIVADTDEIQQELADGGRTDLLIDGIKTQTDKIPASPAAIGSAMTLQDDAITSAKYDQVTAHPLESADSGSTEVARTGADGDTLETLSDQADLQATATDLATVDGLIDTLLERVTATRAGYLDTLTNLDAAISSRLAESGYTAPDNASIALILADTGELQANQGNWLTANLTTLESRLSAARAGYLDLLNSYLDVAVSSRLAESGYTAPDNASIALILADTGELQANQGNWLTANVSGLATSAALGVVDDLVDSIKTILDKLDSAMELDGAVYRFTENSLEMAPAGEGGGGDAPTVEEIRIEMDEHSSKLSLIDATISSRLASTGYTAPQSYAQIQAAAEAALEAYDPPTDTEMNAALSALQTHGDSEWATEATGPIEWNPSGEGEVMPFTDQSGTPLENVLVAAYSEGGRGDPSLISSAYSNANGIATLYFSSPGTYYFRAKHASFDVYDWSEEVS